MIENTILKEMNELSKTIDTNQYETFVKNFAYYMIWSHTIGIGAGRMGYSLRSFIMRLNHMGFNASMIGDTNVPRVRKGTVVLINSSSGETPTNVLYAKQAKEHGGTLFCITKNKDSTLAQMSDYILTYGNEFKSNQIMKTAYEQFTMLLFDHIAKDLVDIYEINKDFMENNHSILE